MKPKIVFSDFDGVMTGCDVWIDEDGRELVRCSRFDGHGVFLLFENGIKVVVVSSNSSKAMIKRCENIYVELYHGVKAKSALVKSMLEQRDIDPKDAVYLGDDVMDIPAMLLCGQRYCPSNAHPLVQAVQKVVIMPQRGGEGFFRAVAEKIIYDSDI